MRPEYQMPKLKKKVVQGQVAWIGGKGSGVGEVIWAMSKRKHYLSQSFLRLYYLTLSSFPHFNQWYVFQWPKNWEHGVVWIFEGVDGVCWPISWNNRLKQGWVQFQSLPPSAVGQWDANRAPFPCCPLQGDRECGAGHKLECLWGLVGRGDNVHGRPPPYPGSLCTFNGETR